MCLLWNTVRSLFCNAFLQPLRWGEICIRIYKQTKYDSKQNKTVFSLSVHTHICVCVRACVRARANANSVSLPPEHFECANS